jgi:hypothetical protein
VRPPRTDGFWNMVRLSVVNGLFGTQATAARALYDTVYPSTYPVSVASRPLVDFCTDTSSWWADVTGPRPTGWQASTEECASIADECEDLDPIPGAAWSSDPMPAGSVACCNAVAVSSTSNNGAYDGSFHIVGHTPAKFIDNLRRDHRYTECENPLTSPPCLQHLTLNDNHPVYRNEATGKWLYWLPPPVRVGPVGEQVCTLYTSYEEPTSFMPKRSSPNGDCLSWPGQWVFADTPPSSNHWDTYKAPRIRSCSFAEECNGHQGGTITDWSTHMRTAGCDLKSCNGSDGCDGCDGDSWTQTYGRNTNPAVEIPLGNVGVEPRCPAFVGSWIQTPVVTDGRTYSHSIDKTLYPPYMNGRVPHMPLSRDRAVWGSMVMKWDGTEELTQLTVACTEGPNTPLETTLPDFTTLPDGTTVGVPLPNAPYPMPVVTWSEAMLGSPGNSKRSDGSQICGIILGSHEAMGCDQWGLTHHQQCRWKGIEAAKEWCAKWISCGGFYTPSSSTTSPSDWFYARGYVGGSPPELPGPCDEAACGPAVATSGRYQRRQFVKLTDSRWV